MPRRSARIAARSAKFAGDASAADDAAPPESRSPESSGPRPRAESAAVAVALPIRSSIGAKQRHCASTRICHAKVAPGQHYCTSCECEHPGCTQRKTWPRRVGRRSLPPMALKFYIKSTQYHHCIAHLTPWERDSYARSVCRPDAHVDRVEWALVREFPATDRSPPLDRSMADALVPNLLRQARAALTRSRFFADEADRLFDRIETLMTAEPEEPHRDAEPTATTSPPPP